MKRKLENFSQKNCPRCGSPKFKTWDQLDEEERFLLDRMPLPNNFDPNGRKKHLFCARCFFETPGAETTSA